MRKLAVMAALLVAGAAYADDQLGSTQQETKEAGQAAARDTKQGANEAKDWSKDQAAKADQKANEAGDRMQTTAQESGKTAESKDQMAQSGQAAEMKKDSFDIDGKVSKVSSSRLTVARKDAPAATLHVDHTTKVEVDGKQAHLSELKPGQDVKASFNLKGDKPTAIEIKAEKMKGEKDSTSTTPSTTPGSTTPSNK
ncbi:hypothetical protein [Anaeromyxobacter oryzae]|uniref:DUF5666 domain-containing protein n=1 Tax=Anaeromyxobacter oryzae TaxID=2918170 RepID=A0ABM7X0Q7_9BACT|nr:hypothetical protein [Anaeromyxobacter oryzae]BDG05352.1 hypothetical protein AMOR_43480 [Anaeromyxobacter oryzae]